MEFSSSLYSKHNKILHNISGKRTSELGDMIDYLIHTYYSLTNNTVQNLENNDKVLSNEEEINNIKLLILLISMVVVKRFSYSNPVETDGTSDGLLDICMSFLHKVESSFLSTNALFTLRNLSRMNSSKKRETYSPFEFEAYIPSIDKSIILKEIISDELDNLPSHIKAGVLFVLNHDPDYTAILKIYRDVEVFVIYKVVFKIISNVSNTSLFSKLNMTKLNSQVAHMLFLSGIFKYDPKMLILFTLLKDITGLFQLCELYGGKTISIPTVDELTNIMNVSNDIATKVDKDVPLSVKDKELFTYLATDMTLNTDIDEINVTKVIDIYLNNIITTASTNYDQYTKNLLSKFDISNPEDLRKMYSVINVEFEKQVRFIKELNESIGSIRDVRELVSILKNQESEGTVQPTT